MICKFKKIFTFSLIAFSLFFIGSVVNAKSTMFIGNGTVLNQCTGSTCSYPYGGTTNIRFIGDSTNFEVDHKYTFKLNFSAQTSLASPTLTDCGLNINGAYVSAESRNSGRVNFECNSGYTRCDSNYVSIIIYTMPSTLTSVPYFIQCDMTPSATTYPYTNFTMSISDSNGSVIQALDNNTDRMIEINNYNANQNNKNRDTNTNKITDKIQDFMDSVGTGISNIISNLTTLGSNIVSGIGSAINTAVSTISSGLSSIVNAVGDIVTPIINGIGNLLSPITTKLGEIFDNIVSGFNNLIGLNQVCEMYYSTSASEVLHGDSHFDLGALKDDGTLNSSTSFATSPFLPITNNDTIYYYNNVTSNTTLYTCFYDSNKNLVNCSTLNQNSDTQISFGANSGRRFMRYTFRLSSGSLSNVRGQCQRSGIAGLFQSFTNFVRRIFDNTIGNIWEIFNGIDQVEETPISDLLLMPLNLLNKLHSSLSGTNTRSVSKGVHDNNYQCYSYTIPFDFTGGSNTLTLPCINLENYLGSGIWTTIDLILVGLMIYNVGMMVVSFFESWSSLNDTFDSLYTPNHGTYIPRHSGGDRGMFE